MSNASISSSSSTSLLLPPSYKPAPPKKDFSKALSSMQSSIGMHSGVPRLPFQDMTSNVPSPTSSKAPKAPKAPKPASEKQQSTLKNVSDSAKNLAMLIDKYGAGGQGRMGRL